MTIYSVVTLRLIFKDTDKNEKITKITLPLATNLRNGGAK